MSRTIGVIGGMGPAATLDFLGKLIAATPAEGDQDHLRVLVDNNPKIPDRNAAMAGTGPSPAPVLAEMARGLERQGAEALVMACNTAHAFADDIRAAVAIPFFSIVEESADELARRVPEGAAVGVLATTGCLDAGLYQRALADRGLGALVPGDGERQRLMAAIYRIKTGDVG
ncbi:MAG TPA: amino acid racemase, partial [Caulobacteraceae bacterium]|nr:amino acid racemase [Caulobacteraceae bacterium]